MEWKLDFFFVSQWSVPLSRNSQIYFKHHTHTSQKQRLLRATYHEKLIVKLRLHYNELAQRTATVWRYLTFGDIRCYTLKKSDECDH